MQAAATSIDLSEAEVHDEALRDASAEEVVEWAAGHFSEGLVMSSSFGAHSAVMLHLVSRIAPQTPVIFVDTGYLFPETYRFAETLRARFKLNLHVTTPLMSAARREALFGEEWEQGDEGVTEYLRVHKVEPMQRALDELNAVAWMAGLRGGQSEHRASLPRVGVQNGRIKIHPILPWGDDEVTRYMSEHSLPLHPLVAEGYRSIGDVHSTLPTSDDMDPRDGRILGKKKECGLHLPLSEDVSRSLKSSGL
ncbi:MAG: phosphoadenylyl-sulfate reductase [Polyangiales bacterium]